MSLRAEQISEMAQYLDQAMLQAREVERLTVRCPDLSIADAYRVQDAGIALRVARGERRVGLKMGLTSEAKRRQMNLKSPCYGVLTDQMQVEEASTFKLAGKIHPKIEPEIAFLIAKDLQGPISEAQALDACSGVCAAMEILDSRYVGFKYFSLPDVVADNSSSSYFVMGRTILPPLVADWSSLQMVMSVNGEPVQTARSSEISGDPVRSIVQLCELLHERGLVLPAGSVVLAGAATQAVQLAPGMTVKLSVEKLGELSIDVA